MDSTRLRLSLWGLNPEIDLDQAGMAEVLARAREALAERRPTHLWRGLRFIAAAVVGGVFLLSAMVFVVTALHPALALLLWGLLSIAFCMIIVACIRRRMRPFLHLALQKYGYDLCPRCAYWMRGLQHGVRRCPECGVQREPIKG